MTYSLKVQVFYERLDTILTTDFKFLKFIKLLIVIVSNIKHYSNLNYTLKGIKANLSSSYSAFI